MNAVIVVMAMVLLQSPPNFVKPVDVTPKTATYKNLIKLADQADEGFIRALSPEDPVTYDEIRHYAIYECNNNRQGPVELIDALIEIEKSYNPPPSMRGMLLAAACMESGYNPHATGDHKFSKSKKKPMAIGILQLWPVYEKIMPGLDRRNPEQAARAWMNHIVKKIPKVKKQCKYRTAKKIWLAAWVTGIRYKKAGGRCNERPLHYRLLTRWHKSIKKDREHRGYCTSKETCGC